MGKRQITDLTKEETQKAQDLHRKAFIFDGLSLFYNLQEKYFQNMKEAAPQDDIAFSEEKKISSVWEGIL